LLAVPFAMALILSTSVRAEEKEAKEAKKDGEWTGTLGCGHCAFSKETAAKGCCAAAKIGDKVYLLKGDKAPGEDVFYNGGQYVIKGTISADGKSIEVTEIKKKEG
jgi:hypothetical protein